MLSIHWTSTEDTPSSCAHDLFLRRDQSRNCPRIRLSPGIDRFERAQSSTSVGSASRSLKKPEPWPLTLVADVANDVQPEEAAQTFINRKSLLQQSTGPSINAGERPLHGWLTVQVESAQKFIASWIDCCLAWKGNSWQQTDRPLETNRPDYLFESVAGPFATQGGFNKKAQSCSLQF